MTSPSTSSVHIPVHDSSETDEYNEDPFDEELLDSTVPPMRYCPVAYPKPQQKHRRESSRERERLYRELVGHEPYKMNRQLSNPTNNPDCFFVTLDVKHYRPEEITLKVDGKIDYLEVIQESIFRDRSMQNLVTIFFQLVLQYIKHVFRYKLL